MNLRHQTIQLGSDAKLNEDLFVNSIGRILQIHPVDLKTGLITLGEAQFVVGRDPTSDLVVSERAVSRHHARFEKKESGFVVTDLGSTNGTWVNGERIASEKLNSG